MAGLQLLGASASEVADLKSQVEVVNLGTDWSAGDNQAGYSAVVTGRKLAIYDGTNAAPRTATAPTVKVVTTSAVKEATIGAGDGADQLAAIIGTHIGKAGSGTQTVGVAGFAKNASNEEENPDACGLYGVGRITGGTSAKAGAFGAYLAGRRDVATAIATGAEIQVQNYTETAGSYLSNGSSDTKGIWLNANGNADSGVGIQIQNAFGRQFKVGIGFGNQNAGGKVGGVADSSIRDDSESAIALDLRGKHSTAALRVTKESGVVLIGAEALTGESPPQLMEIHAGGVAKTPLFKLTAGANVNITQAFNNSTANFIVGLAGVTNGLMTGTAAGDGVIAAASAKVVHIGRSAATPDLKVGGGVGFYGTAPQAKPTGVPKTAEAIWTALNTLGLIA